MLKIRKILFEFLNKSRMSFECSIRRNVSFEKK